MNHPTRRVRGTFRRGIFMADVMLGLVLLGILTGILISATSRTQRAADRLSNARTAGRVAQEVLVDVQAGLPAPQPRGETKISVEPAEGGAKVPGRRWVQVVVSFRGESALLVGLVPEAAPASQPSGGAQ